MTLFLNKITLFFLGILAVNFLFILPIKFIPKFSSFKKSLLNILFFIDTAVFAGFFMPSNYLFYFLPFFFLGVITFPKLQKENQAVLVLLAGIIGGFLLPKELSLFHGMVPLFLDKLTFGILIYLLYRFFSSFKRERILLTYETVIFSLGLGLLSIFVPDLKMLGEMAFIPLALIASLFILQRGKEFYLSGLVLFLCFEMGLTLTFPQTSLLVGIALLYPVFEFVYSFIMEKKENDDRFLITRCLEEYPSASDKILKFLKYRLLLIVLIGVLGVSSKQVFSLLIAAFILFETIYRLLHLDEETPTIRSLFKQVKSDLSSNRQNSFKDLAETLKKRSLTEQKKPPKKGGK